MMKKLTAAWLCLLLTAVLALTGCVALAEDAEAPLPTPTPLPTVTLELNGYVLTFADLLPETIAWAADEESHEADAVFTLQLGEETLPLFTMTVMQDQSYYVVILRDEQERPVPVGFDMATLPEDAAAEAAGAFALAQEEIHVILATLALTAVPAEELVVAEDPAASLVKVETAACELTYPARLADVLKVRQEQDGSLVFLALAGEKEIPAFTLVIGDDTGDIVLMRSAGDGSRVAVSFMMHAAPQGLTDGEKKNFYSAQDAVNDVMASLALR